MLETVGLVALFHVFYPAWAAASLLLGGERLRAAWREGAGGAGRAIRLVREGAPFALAALAVAPSLLYFETLSVASGFSRELGWSVGGWLSNLGEAFVHLARHEWLLPALVTRTASAALYRPEVGSARDPRSRCAAGLLAFAVGYAAIVAVNPLVYERYFVALSPLLAAAFVLDGSSLIDSAPRRERAVAVVAGLVLASLFLRAPELLGRLQEIREPVVGPVDAVVAHLDERYADPSALVVATNYEALPLMFYLESHVIVGLTGHNLGAERELRPDVLVPRGGWPRGLPELRRFASRDRYEPVELAVRDVHFNNVPSLSRTGAMPDVHRFRTAELGPDDPRLRVYHRVSDGGS